MPALPQQGDSRHLIEYFGVTLDEGLKGGTMARDFAVLSRRDSGIREIPKASSLWLLFCPAPALAQSLSSELPRPESFG